MILESPWNGLVYGMSSLLTRELIYFSRLDTGKRLPCHTRSIQVRTLSYVLCYLHLTGRNVSLVALRTLLQRMLSMPVLANTVGNLLDHDAI
jgi:hypothetical protein